MKFTKNLSYDNACELFCEHEANTPREYASEAYERTRCGVWTSFLLADGGSIPSADLTLPEDTMDYANFKFVGVLHGTIVEGSDAEFQADPLLFPFTDEQLADAWQYLEDCVNECLGDGEEEQEEQEQQSDAGDFTWHLLRYDGTTWTHLGTFNSPYGQDCWGSDMHEWMVEEGHYGDHDPDMYDWEGDSNSVAAMAKEQGMPDFTFVWRDADNKSPNPY